MWKLFVSQILEDPDILHHIHKRFLYGELRLDRLNKIYRFARFDFLRGYLQEYHDYADFFGSNLAWVASAIVYVAIILTAMQVGLATEKLNGNGPFQSASYGFAVFAILGPLAVLSLIALVFLAVFVGNWVATRRFWYGRLHNL